MVILIGVGMSPCQHGDHPDHAHNANHGHSADHGHQAHQFLEEIVGNMLLPFGDHHLQYFHMQISIFILIFFIEFAVGINASKILLLTLNF